MIRKLSRILKKKMSASQHEVNDLNNVSNIFIFESFEMHLEFYY